MNFSREQMVLILILALVISAVIYFRGFPGL
jgi:hypothetical protein